MNKCYDSLDEQFLCQMQKIQKIYAQEVYNQFKIERYGVVTKKGIGAKRAGELLALMEYLQGFDLSQVDPNTYRNKLYQDAQTRANAAQGCTTLPGWDICSISDLLETINSL